MSPADPSLIKAAGRKCPQVIRAVHDGQLLVGWQGGWHVHLLLCDGASPQEAPVDVAEHLGAGACMGCMHGAHAWGACMVAHIGVCVGAHVDACMFVIVQGYS